MVAAPFPATGFLKLSQIIGARAVTPDEAERNKKLGKGPRRPRQGVPGIFPVSRTTWYDGIAKGIYPPPVKLGSRAVAWRVEDVFKLLEALA